ncbi:protein kinase [Streptomyces cinerochromogenes]|uniref:non-specific serine/threonine protein kinase n=1 Tax=Streptomyces cinerochromogenes TaxID=66422 RepID=A0ABW7AWQ3_9ACTN
MFEDSHRPVAGLLDGASGRRRHPQPLYRARRRGTETNFALTEGLVRRGNYAPPGSNQSPDNEAALAEVPSRLAPRKAFQPRPSPLTNMLTSVDDVNIVRDRGQRTKVYSPAGYTHLAQGGRNGEEPVSLETDAGRFRITGIVGRGNMGEVHRAEDLRAGPGSPQREVAVKTVLRGRTGIAVDASGAGKEIDRFRREARIMRMLSQSHPNLTLLIDGGVDGTPGGTGLPYLAMELLDGHPLADLVDEEPQFPVSWVAAIGAQIAAGLAAAHTAGVVHRDLKPANVMLTGDGTLKIRARRAAAGAGCALLVRGADEGPGVLPVGVGRPQEQRDRQVQ